jgi:GNAT superfamily N-acetyltransferase
MKAHSNSPLTRTSRRDKLSPHTRPPVASQESDRGEGSDTKRRRQSTTRFQVKELGKETWPDFERMVEKHDGVWGGCWCTWFHMTPTDRKQWSGKHHEYKEKLVRTNRSHAALVYDGADVVGWCQFGPLVELPGRMRGYGDINIDLPRWRTTCFFVDRDHRREGVARAALEGALRFIAEKGGGTIDGYPIALPKGKKYSSSFIWGGTESMYRDLGFRPLGSFGTSNRVMVMRKTVRSLKQPTSKARVSNHN